MYKDKIKVETIMEFLRLEWHLYNKPAKISDFVSKDKYEKFREFTDEQLIEFNKLSEGAIECRSYFNNDILKKLNAIKIEEKIRHLGILFVLYDTQRNINNDLTHTEYVLKTTNKNASNIFISVKKHGSVKKELLLTLNKMIEDDKEAKDFLESVITCLKDSENE